MTEMTRSPAKVTAIDTQAQAVLTVRTRGEDFIDITREVRAFLAETGGRFGMVFLFCRHTSASLTIQENADPDVQTDLLTALHALAPEDRPWVHHLEGPDDMPAHVRSMLTDSHLAIPVREGKLCLGTWQGIYLVEHRIKPHEREIILAFSGRAAP